MAMVSRPPSTIVCWTLSTEFWMPRELSRTISSLTSGGSDGLQLGHGAAHAAGHLDGVGALRLDDVDGERPLAVQRRDVLAAPAGRRPRWRPGAGRPGARPRRATIRSAKLPGSATRPVTSITRSSLPRCDVAGREVLILVPDRPHDVVDADAQRMHAAGIELDVDLALDAAGDGGAADVAHGLQALDDDLVGQRREVAHRADVGAHGDRHDRLVVGIEALDQRLLDLRPEGGADLLDLLAHVLQGDRRRHRQLELGDDDRLAFERARGQRLEAGDGVDRFLDLAADLGLDRLGRGAGIVRW